VRTHVRLCTKFLVNFDKLQLELELDDDLDHYQNEVASKADYV